MKNRENKTLNIKTINFFYGWIIVFVGAVGIFFSGPGQTYSISIFIDHYIKDYNWSRSLVSSLYSISTLTAGFCLPIIGRKIDVVGHRKMFVIIPLILSIACLWMSFVMNPLMLGIGFIFLRLMGQGSMTLLSQTLIPQWFIRRRGTALSLIALGGVMASAFMPLLNNWLIINEGVVFAWRVLAMMLIGIMIPLGWVLVRNKPEDTGEYPDGKLTNGKPTKSKENTNLSDSFEPDIEEHSWTLAEAKKTRAFWFMLFCMIVPSMIITGLTFHMVSIVENKGFTSTFAATVLGTVRLCKNGQFF